MQELIVQRDFGTPARESTERVTLTIDGAQVTVPAGTSLMRAALMAGTQIPKLCATDSLEPFGSCRLCLVEIDGRAGTPASCIAVKARRVVSTSGMKRISFVQVSPAGSATRWSVTPNGSFIWPAICVNAWR